MSGYGRGYYGDEQLARTPPRRGGGWGKIALVVGVGAVIWLMWPRRPKLEAWANTAPLPPSPSPLPPPSPSLQTLQPVTLQPALSAVPPQQLLPQTTQAADTRGYPSQQAYEDAVVATARQLQSTGAQITLAPHLSHLATRLG